jgi:hypothetical protein
MLYYVEIAITGAKRPKKINNISKYPIRSFTMFRYLLFSLLLVTACTSDTRPIQTDDPYYLKLEKQCDGNGCCLTSLRGMIAARSKLANGTCSKGYRKNMLRCIDTYVWCEKIEK